MNDLLWRIIRQSQDLQTQRQDMKGIWDDDAAREINSRYLNPHEEDSAEVLKALGQQMSSLTESQNELKKADEKALIAEEQAHQVDETVLMIEQETDNAHARHGQHVEHFATSRDMIPTIYNLIENANNCCP